jgi:hypothetical protein
MPQTAAPVQTAPPRRPRVSPLPLAIAGVAIIGIVAAFAIGAGNGNAVPQPTLVNDCSHWCGTGTATITFLGNSGTVSGGGCYDTGTTDGIDARFGDWQGIAGLTNYLSLYILPAPLANPTLDENGATPMYDPVVSGSLDGSPFVLGPDVVIRYSADGTGTFSGTDMNGGGTASGTFTCN